MKRYAEKNKGDPEKILQKMERTMCHLEKFCIHHRRREEWHAYKDVVDGAVAQRESRGINGGLDLGGYCKDINGNGNGNSQEGGESLDNGESHEDDEDQER